MNTKHIISSRAITVIIVTMLPFLIRAQETTTLTGTVYSTKANSPIPGVRILSSETGRTAISDEKGNFAFTGLRYSDTLSFRSVGYLPVEMPVRNMENSHLDVFLDESMSFIDEVIVNTGYQSLAKERTTGSFTLIDNQLFNRSVSTDLISRLDGVTNGLLFNLPLTQEAPSTTPDLRVRGVSTIFGESNPLIVIDNFPYEGDINNINPNDVASITVLKDAAAASIWGARAGNGVIVVTTKSGSKSQSPTITWNSSINYISKPDLYYYQRILPSANAVELERDLYNKGLYTINDWIAYTPVVEILAAQNEGTIDETTANRMLDSLKRYDIREDASRYLYRNGVNQQYAINVRGGSDRHQYYISSGLDRTSGHLMGDNHHRFTVNAKNEIQLFSRFRMSFSANYMEDRTANNGLSMSHLTPTGMADVYPYARLADDAGNAVPIVKNNRFAYTESVMANGLLDWHFRPLDEIAMNDNTSDSKEIRLNSAMTYRLPFGLNAEARYQYQWIGSSSRNHHVQESYFARNLINQFTQSDGTRPIPVGGILNNGGSGFNSHYGRFQLDYDRDFGEWHNLAGLAGFEIRQERFIGSGSSRLYGYDDDLLTYADNIDFAASYQMQPRSSGRIPSGVNAGNQTMDRFVSYYANLAYTLKGKYTLTASSRWDASNIFGVAFNQKGVPLWSVGASWNVSDEKFADLDWLSYAKLRATFGLNGNAVRTISSLPVITYSTPLNSITRLPYGNLLSVGNPDLRWEQVQNLNFGMDFALFDRRISGSVEWYNKKGTDLLGDDLLDPTTGIHQVGSRYNLNNRRNYADLSTTGVDIELNTVNIRNVVQWQTTFLLNYARNTVTDYRTRQNAPIIDFLQGSTAPVVEGLPREQIYAIPWYGLDATGAPLVMVDGELGTDYNAYFNGLDRDKLLERGVSIPPYFGSVRNTISWRAFSASFNIVWKAGHRFRRESINYNALFGTTRMGHIDYLDRWQNPGDELSTNVPSMPETSNLRRDQAYLFSEALVERGDLIRFQDINLSYELPREYAKRVGLSQVRLYTYARNLGILWKYTDLAIDPDVRARYPQPFQIAFGLQIQL